MAQLSWQEVEESVVLSWLEWWAVCVSVSVSVWVTFTCVHHRSCIEFALSPKHVSAALWCCMFEPFAPRRIVGVQWKLAKLGEKWGSKKTVDFVSIFFLFFSIPFHCSFMLCQTEACSTGLVVQLSGAAVGKNTLLSQSVMIFMLCSAVMEMPAAVMVVSSQIYTHSNHNCG